MKTLFLLPLFCLALATQAQHLSTDSATHTFVYTENLTIEDAPKEALYAKAWNWCAARYKAAREMTKKQRKNITPLVNNAWSNIYLETQLGPQAVQMFYTLTIDVTDQGYRYKLSNIQYKTYSDPHTNTISEKFSAESVFGKDSYLNNGDIRLMPALYLEATNQYVQQLISGLKATMSRDSALANNR